MKSTSLLLLSLLTLSLVSGALPAWSAESTNVSKWEKDIKAFEAADKTNPPPQHAILFAGSSSIRLWKTLREDFKEFPVINRGFGGSQLADSVEFAERIILPCQPRQILIYAGDNDIAGGKSPERVCADFQAFVKKIHAALPQTRIGYLAIKPCSSRWKLVEKVKAANQLIADFAKKDERLAYIDTFTPILGEDGKPNDELFKEDKLHLNQKGYAVWAGVVRPFLK